MDVRAAERVRAKSCPFRDWRRRFLNFTSLWLLQTPARYALSTHMLHLELH